MFPGDDIAAIQKGYQDLKALIADKISPMLKKYRDHPDSLGAELKKDNTWATRADLDVQEAMVRFISSNFPRHRIIAEEMFSHKSAEELRAFMEDVKRAEYVWVIDPIDGTKPFKEGGQSILRRYLSSQERKPYFVSRICA